MLAKEISYRIDRLYERFRMDGITDSLTFVEQISYLLLLRFRDEISKENTPNYHFPPRNVLFKVQSEAWKAIESARRSERISVIENCIRNIESYDRTFPGIFTNATFIVESQNTLDEALDLVNGIFDYFGERKDIRQLMGDIYDYLLSKMTLMPGNGELFTPRTLTKLMVELISPNGSDIICDPACGTGGFLVYVNKHIKEIYKNRLNKETSNTFTGIDTNPRMVRIAQLNMIFNEVEKAVIENKNLLYDFDKAQKYSIVISNPPIGAEMSIGNIDSTLDTNNSHLVFIERIMSLLDKYGKCTVLVPEGFLYNSSSAHTEIRRRLLNEFRVHGIVSLPNGVFLPYTNAKASILVFGRINSIGTIPYTEKVWFYEVTEDWNALNGKMLTNSESEIFTDLLMRWEKREEDYSKWDGLLKSENSEKVEKGENRIFAPSKWDIPQIWFAQYGNIESNNYKLNAAFYKPQSVNEKEYEDPQDVLREVLVMEENVISKIKALLEETQSYEKNL